MTDHYDAILAAALENPSDATGWLILADWLEEEGNPAGEAVRLMCSLERLLTLAGYSPVIQRLRVYPVRKFMESHKPFIVIDEKKRRVVAVAPPECEQCKSEGEEPHSCPFREDIEHDYGTLCTCCSNCESECVDEI
jgi:uncharacterized protein (TIGR02996 family)